MSDESKPPELQPSAPASMDTPFAPARVGNYVLRGRIGQGGMGVVYEGVQDKPSRAVALKLMRHALTTAEQLRRFEQEAQMLGSLAHPNIAQVYEAGTHREGSLSLPFYAMELVRDAKPITQYAQEKCLNRQERLQLMLQACAAVEHAHQQEILHRDLKPSNLLVGSDGILKLIDLGVSRLMSPGHVTLTGSEQLLGTLQYMAPEQLSGASAEPTRSWDVYALGVIFYELILGQRPYLLPEGSPVRAARHLAETLPQRPRKIDRTISKSLEAVLLKALEKDPAARYASAQELARDIRHLLEGRSAGAGSKGPLRRSLAAARQIATRHRLLVLAALMILWGVICFASPLGKATRAVDGAWAPYALSRLNHVPDVPFDQVRMVSLRSDLVATAQRLGERRYNPAFVPSQRPLIARLVEKLTAASPKVIAMDLMIQAPTPFDIELIRAMGEAERAGIPIVAASPRSGVEQGGPGVLPELVANHRVGSAKAAEFRPDLFGVVSVMIDEVKRDDPSFTIHTVAAASGVGKDDPVFVDYQRNICGSVAGETCVLGHASHLIGGPEGGVFQLAVAMNVAEVPPDAVLDAADFDFDDVMQWSDEQVRAAFGGKVVIIGDGRAGRDPVLPVGAGREVRGYRLVSSVVEQMLAGYRLRWPAPVHLWRIGMTSEVLTHFGFLFVASLLGWLCRSWRAVMISSVGLSVVAFVLPFACYRFGGLILGGPTQPLYLILLIPLLFAARRWTTPAPL